MHRIFSNLSYLWWIIYIKYCSKKKGRLFLKDLLNKFKKNIIFQITLGNILKNITLFLLLSLEQLEYLEHVHWMSSVV